IIYEINRRFLRRVMSRFPYDEPRISRMSLIDEGNPMDPHSRRIRMAYLAVVGSHSVNGVAALHTRLLEQYLLHDFHEMFPERFNNKTNGVTPRRWLLQSNPLLADDEYFRREMREIKQRNKDALAAHIEKETELEIDRASLFDVQVKRLHEYKRQLLNVLHIVALYLRIKKDPGIQMVPRTFIFG